MSRPRLIAWAALALSTAELVSASMQAPRQPSATGAAPAQECGRADPSYIRVAEESGGQPLFLRPSESGRVGQFLREMSGTNRETLLWATGAFDQGPTSYGLAVDDTVQRLTVSLSVNGPGSSLSIVRPSGSPVRDVDVDTEVTALTCTRIVTIVNPEVGTWRVDPRGAGRFWLRAGARTDMYLTGVEFVQVGGRPGHEGFFRIPGQPLAGRPATLRLSLSGSVETAIFGLVSLQGETVGSVALDEVSRTNDDREYVGTFELPRGQFRVAVSGRTSNGHPYQRIFHTLFHAETVEIAPADADATEIPAGATTPTTFVVRNVGGPSAFRIVAVDSGQFVTRVDPREFALATGATARVTVYLTVPPDAAPGSGLDLTITAMSTSIPTTTNGIVRHFTLGGPRQ